MEQQTQPRKPGIRQYVKKTMIDGTVYIYNGLVEAAKENQLSTGKIKTMIAEQSYHKDGSRFSFEPYVPKDAKTIGVTFSADMHARIVAEAAAHNMSPPAFVRWVVDAAFQMNTESSAQTGRVEQMPVADSAA